MADSLCASPLSRAYAGSGLGRRQGLYGGVPLNSADGTKSWPIGD